MSVFHGVDGIPEGLLSALVEMVKTVDRCEHLESFWGKINDVKDSVLDETFPGDIMMERGISQLLQPLVHNQVSILSEETWKIFPEDELNDQHALIVDPLDGSKLLHKSTKGEHVFPGYGALITEVRGCRILSSINAGRFGDQYYAFFASEQGIHSNEALQDLSSYSPPPTIVVGSSRKRGASRLDRFASSSRRLIESGYENCAHNLGCVWGNVMGIVFGHHGAYVTTHNAMVYDYAGLAYLFQKLGGLVIDLEAEDGVFHPKYGQQALMFLHPCLEANIAMEFLCSFIDDRAEKILASRIS
jgi:fructose-1,6-bisphosphatase/inositol monophosphatase family enzyme